MVNNSCCSHPSPLLPTSPLVPSAWRPPNSNIQTPSSLCPPRQGYPPRPQHLPHTMNDLRHLNHLSGYPLWSLLLLVLHVPRLPLQVYLLLQFLTWRSIKFLGSLPLAWTLSSRLSVTRLPNIRTPTHFLYSTSTIVLCG